MEEIINIEFTPEFKRNVRALSKKYRHIHSDIQPLYAKVFSVDIFTRSVNDGDYAIIGEVKSRDARKFSREEVVVFEAKFAEMKKLENIDRAVGFIFSRSGFTKEAESYCREKGIACSEDERWLEIGKGN